MPYLTDEPNPDSLHSRLHSLDEAELEAVESLDTTNKWRNEILHYNACPKWFKPLRDMGISPDMWLDGSIRLALNIDARGTTVSDAAYDRVYYMRRALRTWLESNPDN